MALFTATLAQPYRHSAPFTKGRAYEVIDFNDCFGTYLVLNDDGERASVDWDRFEDLGQAARAYSANRVFA